MVDGRRKVLIMRIDSHQPINHHDKEGLMIGHYDVHIYTYIYRERALCVCR